MEMKTDSNQPLKWLITGGCGFIGTSLIRNLAIENKHFIRVLDNLTVGTEADLAKVCQFSHIGNCKDLSSDKITVPGCELVVGDIRDATVCRHCSRGMDVIVHLAANTGVGPSVENPELDMKINVGGTFNMLESARSNHVKRFIFASSGAPAGECEPPIHEELPPHPVSPYGASKLAGEGYCSAYYRTFGVETIALRFGNVYGPGSGHKSSVVAKFIKKAMAGEPLEIYGDGTQTRDFIFIEDLVKAIRLSQSTDGVGGEIFQIATNKETTVTEMTNLLIPALEKYGINNASLINGENRLGDVMRNYSDISKAKRMLGWISKTDLAQGLDTTVSYFIDQKDE